ncbi:hypothetical protein [Microbacterium dauci]|uniref:Uncharacterized protein n=1 Tax=Microbacterium dauci TaxID=3048008 RepID=A0ABT6ZF37_9MICO|nr:hypothetical protein [Microbacterium sp. LX3-4]MDJ1114777.1 hypothetical protein [Microbacterium sp. LX3-4]
MSEPITAPGSTKIFRAAIWVAIGALIAAALVCVVWVLIGDANGLVGRAFLTIFLLAAFAGVAILEAALAPRRAAWFSLASMVSWVAALIVGAFMIWMPEAFGAYDVGIARFFKFLLIVLILQGVLLHIRLYSKAFGRYQTTFTSVVAYVTMGLLVILAIMLTVSLMFSEFVDFLPIYWRVVVALAILVAVGTALVPLVNALFAPKRPRPAAPLSGYGAAPQHAAPQPHATQHAGQYTQAQQPPAPQQGWPTFADGRTPLPVMPDGSPDWNAYYTGWPTYPQQPSAPVADTAAPIPDDTAPSARHAAPEQPAPPVYPPAPPAPPQP